MSREQHSRPDEAVAHSAVNARPLDETTLLKAAGARIVAAHRQGTGYLVRPDVLVTCAHVVRPLPPGIAITVQFSDEATPQEASVERFDDRADWAILRLKTPTRGRSCLHEVAEARADAPWRAFGYPESAGEHGIVLVGVVRDPRGKDDQGNVAMQLFCEEAAAAIGAVLGGASGAPVLSAGRLIGHLRRVNPDESNRTQLGLIYGCPASAYAAALASLPDPANRQAERGQPWTVPAPSPYFSGRDAEIKALRTALSGERRAAISQVQAVSGLGGIGKTQLALAYAREYRAEYAAGYFVRADSEVALHEGLSEVGRQLGWPSGLKPQERLQTARRWLESSSDILLILDNADPLALAKPLCSAATKAHVLVTTRTWNCGAIGVRQPVRLQKMSTPEALAFMQERTGNHDEPEALSQIVEELGGLPLALEQAGAYIAEREMRYTDYLAAYRHRRTALLRERPEHGDYPASVATTWSLNIEEARKHSPGSAALMELSAFLAPDAIPEELLIQGASELGEELGKLKEPGGLDDLLAPLLRYSLITRDRESRTFSLHRLLQATILDGLTATDRAKWQERLIQALCQVFPAPRYETWGACARLVDHAQAVLQRKRSEEVGGVEVCSLLRQVGEYLHQQAQYALSHPLLVESLRIEETAPEPNDQLIAASCARLATSHQAQGRYEEAEPLMLRAHGIWEGSLGADHPGMAKSYNNLGMLYRHQGRYAEAERLLERAHGIRERSLGADHPNVATICNNLASLYEAQGRYEEAERLYARAHAMLEQSLGADHPGVATSCNNLASLYYAQSRYEEAEPLMLRAHRMREKALGADHPDVAKSCNNLASLYSAQGRYEEAERLMLRAHGILEKSLGADHPDVATSCNNLASLYYAQGRYEEAAPLMLRAHGIRDKALGADHPDVAKSCNNLGMVYRAQGRYEEAERLMLRALSIVERTVGTSHPNFIACRNNLAELYESQGRTDEAKQARAGVYKRE